MGCFGKGKQPTVKVKVAVPDGVWDVSRRRMIFWLMPDVAVPDGVWDVSSKTTAMNNISKVAVPDGVWDVSAKQHKK